MRLNDVARIARRLVALSARVNVGNDGHAGTVQHERLF